MTFLTERYRTALRWAIRARWMAVVALPWLALARRRIWLLSGIIGSEFLPHLDEGAIWVRGTLAPSTGPTEGIRVANQARIILARSRK